MDSLPDRRDAAAARRAAERLHRGMSKVHGAYEARRLELMRAFVAETLRAICLPLLDLQEEGGIDVDGELLAMRPPETWPWSSPVRSKGGTPRYNPPRFLHVIRPQSAESRVLALHVNGPSLEIVLGIEGGMVWTRHGRGRIRLDRSLTRDDFGREIDAWCGPPFADRGYRLQGIGSDEASSGPVGHFSVGWLAFRAPWSR